MNDSIFGKSYKNSDFEFNHDVVKVFDDMLARSVPFYDIIQTMIAEIATYYCEPNSQVIDLGCSLGTTCFNIAQKTSIKNLSIIGVDNSIEMIREANTRKQKDAERFTNIEFLLDDILDYNGYSNTSVVILCLTLQFVRPNCRLALLQRIFKYMNKGGAIILYEKIVFPSSAFNRGFIDFYHNFKAVNGYSKTEIENKRTALENVLIPYSIQENIDLLSNSGFKDVVTFFQWFNFAGFIARKQ